MQRGVAGGLGKRREDHGNFRKIMNEVSGADDVNPLDRTDNK